MNARELSEQLKPPVDFVAGPALLVDARRLKCPLPVLRLARALREGGKQRYVVCATDPATLVDIPGFCAARGFELENHIAVDGYYWFSINAE
jgi:tRNA 2-thiouridine synthesizing protein A